MTLNRSEAIDPARVIQRVDLRPSGVHAGGRRRAGAPARDQRRAPHLFCGAYWGYGFHEDGVVSALRPAPSSDLATQRRAACTARSITGRLRHRRFAPRPHAFATGCSWLYLDLAELDEVFGGRWLWSARRPALAWFRRADYLGDPALPLDERCATWSWRETGRRPAGPIRLLTHLRYFGHCFNPVSFYYCFDAAGEQVEAIVAEVTNTPWGERHAYVLPAPAGARTLRVRFDKAFHVSPFMPMEHALRLALQRAGRAPRGRTWRTGATARKVFDATLRCERARDRPAQRSPARCCAIPFDDAAGGAARSTGRRCGCG